MSSSGRLTSKTFSTNPTSSASFHQMFNSRGNASTSSPTSIMMATDPATSAAAAVFYSPFPPPPPSSCDFNVRSTMVSYCRRINYIVKFHFFFRIIRCHFILNIHNSINI